MHRNPSGRTRFKLDGMPQDAKVCPRQAHERLRAKVCAAAFRWSISARALPRFLIIVALLGAVGLPGLAATESRPDAGRENVGATEVLVLFNTKWPDEDANGYSDSQDVAEYYAARRGIPPDHLLGVSVTDRRAKPDHLSYSEFFRRV